MIEKYILPFAICIWMISNTDLSNCKIKAMHSGALSSYRDSISNIQAGRVKLAATSFSRNGRYIPFNVTFSTSINSNYDLTTSIQNIYSFVPGNARLDFQITGIKQPTVFSGIFVIDSEADWSWVLISYLVASREDFLAGNVILDNDKLIFWASNNTQISFLIQMPSKSQLNSSLVYSIPFISGMLTFDQYLSLSFTDCQYLQNSSLLNLTLRTRYAKYPLQSLSISYVIFNMGSQLQITSLFNISFVPVNINTFLGVSSVESTPLLFNNDNSTSIPKHFGLQGTATQIEIFNEMFGIDGVIIQTQQSIDLLYLPMTENSSTTFYCISKTNCKSYGGYMVFTQSQVFEITSKCQVCGRYMIFNNVSGQCVCISGFVLQDGICVNESTICPSNSSFNHVKQMCQCFQLFVNASGKCRLILQLCENNEVYIAGRCIPVTFNPKANSCPLDYLFINSICVPPIKCLTPKILNTSINQCFCPDQMQIINDSCVKCTENQTFVEKKCVCKQTYFKINGTCLKCNINAYFDGKKCVCLQLFDGDGFSCSPQPKGKAPQAGSVGTSKVGISGITKIGGNS